MIYYCKIRATNKTTHNGEGGWMIGRNFCSLKNNKKCRLSFAGVNLFLDNVNKHALSRDQHGGCLIRAFSFSTTGPHRPHSGSKSGYLNFALAQQ